MLGTERSSGQVVAQVVLTLFKLSELKVSDYNVQRVSDLMRESVDKVDLLAELGPDGA
jgi:hypothetical protein